MDNHKEFDMARLFARISDCVGNTPLVRMNHLPANCKAEIYLKLEFMNPCSSVKDRLGAALVDAAETEKENYAGQKRTDRTDQRQYGDRPGHGRGRTRIPDDPDHARIHEPGTHQTAEDAGSQGGADRRG